MTNKVRSCRSDWEPKTGGILAYGIRTYHSIQMIWQVRIKIKIIRGSYPSVGWTVAKPGHRGRYEPGSTFKPMGALVALDEGLISPSYGCLSLFWDKIYRLVEWKGRHVLYTQARDMYSLFAVRHLLTPRNLHFTQVRPYGRLMIIMFIGNVKETVIWNGGGIPGVMHIWLRGARLGIGICQDEDRGFIPDTSSVPQ